jgi:hypothetical protein
MTNIHGNGAAAQVLPSVPTAVASVDAAIRSARFALRHGPLDWAISHIEKASRVAGGVGNPHASELTNLAGALEPAFETVKLVEMCLLDMFPEK